MNIFDISHGTYMFGVMPHVMPQSFAQYKFKSLRFMNLWVIFSIHIYTWVFECWWVLEYSHWKSECSMFTHFHLLWPWSEVDVLGFGLRYYCHCPRFCPAMHRDACTFLVLLLFLLFQVPLWPLMMRRGDWTYFDHSWPRGLPP